ncbi:MAG: hypothetical protein AAFQ74_13640 [Cyanobacteria bacterium J06623_4]
MMALKFIRRLVLGASILCITQAGLSVQKVNAQPLPAESISFSLLPLETRYLENASATTPLDIVAETVNTQFAEAQAAAAAQAEIGVLQFEDIPVVGNVITETGELNMNLNLPVSVSVGSVLGSYGIVIHQELSISDLGSSPDTVAPINR